jgi:hypothetical protein
VGIRCIQGALVNRGSSQVVIVLRFSGSELTCFWFLFEVVWGPIFFFNILVTGNSFVVRLHFLKPSARIDSPNTNSLSDSVNSYTAILILNK